METKAYTTIDRAALGWTAGPWDGEPDKMQWPDEATGLPCLAVRNQYAGNWCGYVGVPLTDEQIERMRGSLGAPASMLAIPTIRGIVRAVERAVRGQK